MDQLPPLIALVVSVAALVLGYPALYALLRWPKILAARICQHTGQPYRFETYRRRILLTHIAVVLLSFLVLRGLSERHAAVVLAAAIQAGGVLLVFVLANNYLLPALGIRLRLLSFPAHIVAEAGPRYRAALTQLDFLMIVTIAFSILGHVPGLTLLLLGIVASYAAPGEVSAEGTVGPSKPAPTVSPEEAKANCQKCGKEILAATAARTGGFCMRCR